MPVLLRWKATPEDHLFDELLRKLLCFVGKSISFLGSLFGLLFVATTSKHHNAPDDERQAEDKRVHGV